MGNGVSTKCPYEEVQQVSNSDASLGEMATCQKFHGRCAYFNNPEEFQKIGANFENCQIYQTFK